MKSLPNDPKPTTGVQQTNLFDGSAFNTIIPAVLIAVPVVSLLTKKIKFKVSPL